MALDIVSQKFQSTKPVYIDVNMMFGRNSYPELVYNEDAIRGSIFNLLTTPIGSRAFNPEYGSRLYHLLQEPKDAMTAKALFISVMQAISRWEPRVEVIQAQSSVFPTQDGFQINLSYYMNPSKRVSTFELEVGR